MNSTLKNFARLRAQHILYADRAIIVINKPHGLICQSDKVFQERTGRLNAFDSLRAYLKRKLDLREEPYQVHRLDKNTTGVLLLAKSSRQAKSIQQQFKTHTIEKSYLALVRGGQKSFPADRGTINAPLKVIANKAYVDEAEGSPALTDWELLGSSEKVPISLLRLTLHSGMKHQIRVHLASILKTPILGDTLYSKKPPPPEILNLIPPNVSVSPSWLNTKDEQQNKSEDRSTKAKLDDEHRMFLHAAHVDLTRYRYQPQGGSSKSMRMGITAPLPEYFVQLCNAAGLTSYLSPEYITGSLSISGNPFLGEEIPEVEGKWFLHSHKT